MSPKRKDQVAPPPGPDEWDIRYANNDAVKGWQDLCQQAASNTSDAWQKMRTNPAPTAPTPRHHQLKFDLAYGTLDGRTLPQWQIEVTGGGRIWYLLDVERHTVWLAYAGTKHPKATD